MAEGTLEITWQERAAVSSAFFSSIPEKNSRITGTLPIFPEKMKKHTNVSSSP